MTFAGTKSPVINRGRTRLKATEEERDVFDCSGTAKKAACLMQGQTVKSVSD